MFVGWIKQKHFLFERLVFSVWFILAWLVQSSNKGWSALLPTYLPTYLPTCGYMYGSWVKQFIFAPWDTNRCITCGALKYGRVGVDDILSGVMTVRKFGEPSWARQFSNMHSHLRQPPLATHPYMLMARCFISLHKISWKTW